MTERDNGNPAAKTLGKSLPEWVGNESCGFTQQELTLRLNNRNNRFSSNEEIAPPFVKTGIPDPTL